MFNTESIQDTEKADQETERAIAMLLVYRNILSSIGSEALSLVQDVPGRLRLSDYAHNEWSYTPRNAADRKIKDIQDRSDKPLSAIRLVLPYDQFSDPSVTKVFPKWKTDEELAEGIRKENRHVFESLIELGARATKARRDYNTAASEYRAITARYEEIITEEPGTWAQDLKGLYIRIGNKNRSTTGWVTGGRGKTVYVVQDPMSNQMEFSYTGQMEDDLNATTVANSAINAVRWHGNTDGRPFSFADVKPEKYVIGDNTEVSIILTKTMSRTRRGRVESWVRRGQRADEAGRLAFITRQAWYDNGGQTAKERVSKVAEAESKAKALDFSRVIETNINAGVAKAWAREAMAALKEAGLDSGIQEKVVEAVVASHGGRPTEAEEALIAAEPAGTKTLTEAIVEAFITEGEIVRFVD
jgi:hypothetical protein